LYFHELSISRPCDGQFVPLQDIGLPSSWSSQRPGSHRPACRLGPLLTSELVRSRMSRRLDCARRENSLQGELSQVEQERGDAATHDGRPGSPSSSFLTISQLPPVQAVRWLTFLHYHGYTVAEGSDRCRDQRSCGDTEAPAPRVVETDERRTGCFLPRRSKQRYKKASKGLRPTLQEARLMARGILLPRLMFHVEDRVVLRGGRDYETQRAGMLRCGSQSQ
jgi:hypothetical protein